MARWQIVVKKSEATNQTKDQNNNCWFDQNNSKIKVINLVNLTLLDFEVMFIRLQKKPTYQTI